MDKINTHILARKATLKPVEVKEVKWIRYTGDNFDEVEQFVNEVKVFPKENHYFYLSTNGDKEIYWKEHGFIRKGDFVVLCNRHYLFEAKWDDFAIVSWKDFPRMVNEDIPIYMI